MLMTTVNTFDTLLLIRQDSQEMIMLKTSQWLSAKGVNVVIREQKVELTQLPTRMERCSKHRTLMSQKHFMMQYGDLTKVRQSKFKDNNQSTVYLKSRQVIHTKKLFHLLTCYSR